MSRAEPIWIKPSWLYALKQGRTMGVSYLTHFASVMNQRTPSPTVVFQRGLAQ
jgi:hypothetical protein